MISVRHRASQLLRTSLLGSSQKMALSSSAQLSSDQDGSAMPQAQHFPALKTPMLPPDTFKGKVAFVSGGGTGLGKSMTTMLSQLGASVCIMSRRQKVLDDTAAEVSALTGNRVLPVSADVRDPAAVTAAVDACADQLGLPDILINNAAGNFISPTERLSANAWRTIVDIVLNGTAFLTMDVGKRWIAAGRGGVMLNITTTYTRTGSGFVAPSCSAKAGVEALTQTLAAEWGRYGIRINCIAPGPIETEGAFSRLDPSGQFRKVGMKAIPAGRFGEPEELTNLATFLVSDYSNWISGESVAIDGGGLPFRGGEFNQLVRVTPEQWDMMEQMIRATNKKSKL
ncbi:2,4-dienoyl-CoA reductase [(3E)-enoyl-CoA-producing], mitochondrial-like isoform X1 [Amphibalanus amphitrite]|uniref:2,4-dienoyl-CoA reductase [(3E)-enoyl-CoA-producing], mitochondrial-like isoform X1 n=2 Tax=Amphibalanus amphitrite TaxID=1232801 RepID=UPI001C920BF4|nr:2,4-dienoyl-CoA reductase [(3E)-enoyl-CoA-producing], mitochondrial-like isoform X1 [Amphibalanus amphitrite]XP_043189837.1 2,4-dienoyl-CoA reductase [(3E)-enoyl-CoA-producing], mitochondrial-like isoform X1 [Amphibalanus amphitrite]XP_043189838.1 2,4-dienoyl-CoA reductase [(3E)-enoyl-CoA-producing], mitochondrial-like isoform X1 [Amphibalanus amphitrite]XP_043189839.1 2,4-dienoyl-CoA reductase [(3E)-enoyl-CoA-producing], mitochondrial-like isoform X1 [Amphibalanus amphitrite]XP_043189840.1 